MQPKDYYRGYCPPNYPLSNPSPYSAMPYLPSHQYAFQPNTPSYDPYNLKNRQSSSAGAVGTGILTGIANAKSAVENVEKIISVINTPRSVVLQINNHTDLTFRKVYEKHTEGGWALTPTGQIGPKQTLVFGAQSIPWTLQGAIGKVIYEAPGVELDISWSNPYGGSNDCNMDKYGEEAYKYWINKECGSGFVAANMRYEIYPAQ